MGSKTKKQYTSKGIVGHPKRTRATGADRLLNQLKAWKAGKSVKVTIPRQRDKLGNMIGSGEPKGWARELWGDPNRKARVMKDGN